MAVITVRTTGAEHARWKDSAHAARTSLNDFCVAAIADAADRWAPTSPPIVAEAATDVVTREILRTPRAPETPDR